MNNVNEENKTTKKSILIIAFIIVVIISLGTYAWLSYASQKTAMVLTIGNINSIEVRLSPYQINATLAPKTQYTSGILTTVSAANNSTSAKKIELYYDIKSISSSLTSGDFKYKIIRTNDNAAYDGTFASATVGKKSILTQSVPAGTTYNYNVYLWIDGYSNANAASGSFEGDLRANILSHTVTFDANGGTSPITSKQVNYGEQYGSLPTPQKTGYTFLGWNGKNMLSLSKSSFSGCTLNADNSLTSNINNSYYASIFANYLLDFFFENMGKTYTYSMSEPISDRSFGVVIYGTRTGGGTYQEINVGVSKNVATFTIANDFTNMTRVELRFNRLGSKFTDTTTTRTNFQLEAGSVATEYEPYYITSDTTVVQDQDHTLTAIWQDNHELVPSTYQLVEYLESTGTQYILTDVIPSSNFKLEADVYGSSSYTGETAFAGVRDSKSIEFYYQAGIPKFWITAGAIGAATAYYDQKIHYIAESNSSGIKLTINEAQYESTNVYTGGTSNPLMIFSYNGSGTPSYNFRGRIYYLKLYDNNVLIRNFIPCYRKSDNVAGLYDTVHNTFYPNGGSNPFILGPNI